MFSPPKIARYVSPPLCEFPIVGKGPNTVSGSTVSNTELSWVFRGSLSFGERAQWVPLSLLFVCKRELTEFVAELTEFAAELSEAQWVLFSETVLSKQYSARFLNWWFSVRSRRKVPNQALTTRLEKLKSFLAPSRINPKEAWRRKGKGLLLEKFWGGNRKWGNRPDPQNLFRLYFWLEIYYFYFLRFPPQTPFKTSIKITSRGYFYIFRGYLLPREVISKKSPQKMQQAWEVLRGFAVSEGVSLKGHPGTSERTPCVGPVTVNAPLRNEQSRSYLAFFRALPASIWEHDSQTLVFAVTWWRPKTPKIASFRPSKYPARRKLAN